MSASTATLFERDEAGDIARTRRRERRQFVGSLGQPYTRDVEIVKTIRRDDGGVIAEIDEEVRQVDDDAAELNRWAEMFRPDPGAPGSYRPGGG
jgi:hypothetical protein